MNQSVERTVVHAPGFGLERLTGDSGMVEDDRRSSDVPPEVCVELRVEGDLLPRKRARSGKSDFDSERAAPQSYCRAAQTIRPEFPQKDC